MEENNSENNINKTPQKMARLAWPKAKYGAILAVIIIDVINIIIYQKLYANLVRPNLSPLSKKRFLFPFHKDI